MQPNHTLFTKLNAGWNAEPNAPCVEIRRSRQQDLAVSFLLNAFQFPRDREGDRGELVFADCWRYRLGPTNDEGWSRRQCRFSFVAPEWGEFYRVDGDLKLEWLPGDAWVLLAGPRTESHHFLFYFRDETFECDAASWSFRVFKASD